MSIKHLQLQREITRKGVLFAWSTGFLNDLRNLAANKPDVEVEDFGGPRDWPGFATPPIGRAILRRDDPR